VHAKASIAMIGGPNAGKSHFTFQLFGRLSEGTYALKLREMPNMELFREGLERLNNGLPASHTNLHKYEDADLRLVDARGNYFDLLWPDYGGEQISLILQERGIDEAWKRRLDAADAFLLFVRLHEIIDYKNIVEHPLAAELEQREQASKHIAPELTSQVGIIEMLQMLVWSRRQQTNSRMLHPKLGILLTCWDELGIDAIQPARVLTERAPLLEQYIRANWNNSSYFVLGVSSLERPLDKDSTDDEFVSRGPESFGYAILSDGSRTVDLTAPLLKMFELLDED
jgi:hypothetical protein